MLKLTYVVDESMGVDPIDPLGTLEISDGRGSIKEEYVYLDSWLSTLVEASKQIDSTERVALEVAEDPEPLLVERNEEGKIVITHGQSVVTADSSDDFQRALRETATSFLAKMTHLPNQERNFILDPIRRFISETLPDKAG